MSTLASAQDVNTDVNGATDKGLPANGIFHGSDFDNVQINNGNLHIEIPVVTVKGRGDTVTYKYVYNSKGWEFDLFTDLPPNIHRGFITGELNNTLQFTLLGGDSFGYTVSYKTNDQVQCANNQGAPIYGTSYSGYTLVELTVKPNGVVMDGNTRVKVLEERGVNVNTLERIILEIPKEPIP